MQNIQKSPLSKLLAAYFEKYTKNSLIHSRFTSVPTQSKKH